MFVIPRVSGVRAASNRTDLEHVIERGDSDRPSPTFRTAKLVFNPAFGGYGSELSDQRRSRNRR